MYKKKPYTHTVTISSGDQFEWGHWNPPLFQMAGSATDKNAPMVVVLTFNFFERPGQGYKSQ